MKKSYEKLILAICALAGIGLAYLGYSKNGAVEADFEFLAKASGKSEVAIEGSEKLSSTLASVAKPLQLEQAMIGASNRRVDSFVGIALFAKKPTVGEKVAKPVDPLVGTPIHPPIENLWWVENRIDPGFGDSPSRDEDGDGYTNLEEYEAKTDPRDGKKYPALIHKLKFVKYESVGYFVWFSSSLGPGQYQFKVAELPTAFEVAPRDRQEQFLAESVMEYNRTKDFINAGTNIFDKGLCQGRYLLKSVIEKEVINEATNLKSRNEFAVIQDLAPNKGDTFEIPKAPSRKDRPATVRYDRTAIFVLDAIGQQNKEFKVSESNSFSLPDGGSEKAYRLAQISPNSVSVEYKDQEGKLQTIEIKKN